MIGGEGGEGEKSDNHSSDDARAWKRLKTGSKNSYNSIRRDSKGYPLFVKSTNLIEKVDITSLDDRAADIDSIAAAGDISIATVASQDVDVTLPERGKHAAIFYSRLPRQNSDVIKATNGPPEPATLPLQMSKEVFPNSMRSADWFIRKATAQLPHVRHQGASNQYDISQSTLAVSQCCTLCSIKLPHPVSASSWESHRTSIAHQLAVNKPMNRQFSATSTSSDSKAKENIKSEEIGRIVLKPSNLGYSALEKMGWQKGLGLGKAEWEYAKKRAKRDRCRNEQHPIVISDSEDEDDSNVEIGSKEWLERMIQEKAPTEALNCTKDIPNVAGISRSVETDGNAEDEEIEDVIRQRPLLEPLAVQMRPDRRGIGKSLPSTSQTRQESSQSRKKVTDQKAEERLTKRQRNEREKRQREEWKALRSSLN